MPWKTSVLVVANVTADSEELLSALEQRAARSPTSFTLIVPPRPAGEQGRTTAAARLERALHEARERGLEIEGRVGDSDPIVAVSEAFDPRRVDEIIVSTLPAGASQWLSIDLPARIARITGVHVRRVVAEPKPIVQTVTRPARQRPGVLAPFTPLTWGRHPDGPTTK